VAGLISERSQKYSTQLNKISEKGEVSDIRIYEQKMSIKKTA